MDDKGGVPVVEGRGTMDSTPSASSQASLVPANKAQRQTRALKRRSAEASLGEDPVSACSQAFVSSSAKPLIFLTTIITRLTEFIAHPLRVLSLLGLFVRHTSDLKLDFTEGQAGLGSKELESIALEYAKSVVSTKRNIDLKTKQREHLVDFVNQMIWAIFVHYPVSGETVEQGDAMRALCHEIERLKVSSRQWSYFILRVPGYFPEKTPSRRTLKSDSPFSQNGALYCLVAHVFLILTLAGKKIKFTEQEPFISSISPGLSDSPLVSLVRILQAGFTQGQDSLSLKAYAHFLRIILPKVKMLLPLCLQKVIEIQKSKADVFQLPRVISSLRLVLEKISSIKYNVGDSELVDSDQSLLDALLSFSEAMQPIATGPVTPMSMLSSIESPQHSGEAFSAPKLTIPDNQLIVSEYTVSSPQVDSMVSEANQQEHGEGLMLSETLDPSRPVSSSSLSDTRSTTLDIEAWSDYHAIHATDTPSSSMTGATRCIMLSTPILWPASPIIPRPISFGAAKWTGEPWLCI